MNESYKRPQRISLTHAYLLSAVLLVCYLVIYQVYPFPGLWNDILLYGITALAAAFAATVATLIFNYFQKDDPPRKVWRNLMIGCWLWFVGEVLWGYYDVVHGEISTGIVDMLWTLGFIFFTFALVHQYSLIAPTQKPRHVNMALLGWVAALILPFAFMYLMHSFNLRAYIDFFYPAADLMVGIAGIFLIFTFQGGMLMRPWIGLVVFGITDFLYAWTEQTGLYAWSAENGTFLTLAIDSSYLFAYIILALGFMGQWVLLRYGLEEL